MNSQFEYQESLNSLHFTEEQKAAIARRAVIVLDPMLATGGSPVGAANILKKAGAKNIKLLCVIACPEGLRAFTEAHPDVQLFCGTVDKGLNEEGYIVPGLGDCGDRIFGTK